MYQASRRTRRHLTRRAVLGGLTAGALAGSGAEDLHAAIVNLVVVGKDGWLFPVWEEVRRVDLKQVSATVAELNSAADILKHAQIEVAIALLPAKTRIYREFLPEDFRFTPDPERRYAVAAEALSRPGTLVPDLATPLSKLHAAQPGVPLFFKGDTHWTAAGAECAATEMARQVKGKIRLPPIPQGGTRLGTPTMATQEKNDLAALLPPADAAKYPLEQFPVRRPVKQGGAALVEDDTADVAVVGNSFMQPLFGFATMLSNQLDRPVSLVWKIHQFGPYQTLLSYVGSEAFRRHRPKLIVWSLLEIDMIMTSDRRDAWGQNAKPPAAFLQELRQAVGV